MIYVKTWSGFKFYKTISNNNNNNNKNNNSDGDVFLQGSHCVTMIHYYLSLL